MNTENKFEWTDELVAECHDYINRDTAGVLTPVGVMKNIEYFKQSKQPKTYTQSEVDAIRKETWDAARSSDRKGAKMVGCFLYQDFNDYLSSLNLNTNDTGKDPSENNEYVKGWKDGFGQGVEFMSTPKVGAASNDIPPLPTDKDWVIFSFSDICEPNIPAWTLGNNGNYQSEFGGSSNGWQLAELLNDNHKSVKSGEVLIHSVKRLSDGVVFTVGDKIGWGMEGSVITTEITKIFIKDGWLRFDYTHNKIGEDGYGSFDGAYNLHKKASTPTQPIVEDNYISILKELRQRLLYDIDENGQPRSTISSLLTMWDKVNDILNQQ